MSVSASTSGLIALPVWMSERRQEALRRFVRFAWSRSDGKLFLTTHSLERLCRDAELLPHEIDRAIDDLFFLKAVEVRSDGLTHVVKLCVTADQIAWRFAKK
jgi:hypothetical protein